MTFAQFTLVLEVHRNLENLRDDLRTNAQLCLDAYAKGVPPADIEKVALQNTQQYERRLQWHNDFEADSTRNLELTSALEALGLSRSEYEAIRSELSQATQTLKMGGDLRVLAEGVLATIEPHQKLFRFNEK